MSFLGTLGTISSFQRRIYDAFYWEIDQFSEVSDEADNHYCSPSFNFKGHKSNLYFFPNGRKGLFAGFFGLYFRSLEYKEPSCVHLTLGLKTRSGRIEKWSSRIIIFPEDTGIGSADLIRRTEFLKREEELAPADCLTFVAILRPDSPEIIRDLVDQTETGHAEENDDKEKSEKEDLVEQTETGHAEENDDKEKSEKEKEGNEKVLADMAKLLASGDRSDAIIVVGEAEYKVHSCILATRTPVFAALFEHDTIEKATRKITITDCEPVIFREFLNYIYTGSVQNLTPENAFSLYQVADKYLTKDLKKMCREYIQNNLSLETFCAAVQLAQRCGDDDLLESSYDYCATNYRHIIRSVEWQQYIKENPIEANEVLIKSLGPP